MKKMTLALLAAAVLHSAAASAQSRMELIDVVKAFLPPAGADFTMYDWAQAGKAASAIRWKTSGIAEAPSYMKKEGFPYVREGEVIVTIDGKLTHTLLGKKPGPGHWNVSLQGPRGGYTRVSIASDVNAGELTPGLLKDSLAKPLSAKAYRCTSPAASSGNTVYEVSVPEKKPAWINEVWSCGSGGCSSELVLLFSKADADKVACE